MLETELINLAYIATTGNPTESLIIIPETVGINTMQERILTALNAMRNVVRIEVQYGLKSLIDVVVRQDGSKSTIWTLPLTSLDLVGRRVSGMVLYYQINREDKAVLDQVRLLVLPCILPGAHVARTA